MDGNCAGSQALAQSSLLKWHEGTQAYALKHFSMSFSFQGHGDAETGPDGSNKTSQEPLAVLHAVVEHFLQRAMCEFIQLCPCGCAARTTLPAALLIHRRLGCWESI